MKSSQKSVVSWSRFTTSLARPPAAWVQVFEKRLSLWCLQCQQHFPESPRSLLARVPSVVLASGAQGVADIYVQKSATLHGVQAQLRGSSRARSGCVSSLPGYAWLRWLGLVLLARASSHYPQFCVRSSPLFQWRGRFFFVSLSAKDLTTV